MLRKLVALGVIGFVGFSLLKQEKRRPAFAVDQGDVRIRDAGPRAMRDAPALDWSRTDEEIDESFPASDPPANY